MYNACVEKDYDPPPTHTHIHFMFFVGYCTVQRCRQYRCGMNHDEMNFMDEHPRL